MTDTLVTLAQQYFNLELPVEAIDLKAAYHQKAKELHPDRNEKDTTALFQEMQDAYTKLSESTAIIEVTNNALTTIEGVLLADLGTGLSLVINSVPCDNCQTKGYTTEAGSRFVECTDCDAVGLTLKTCPQCRGSRGFTALDGSHVTCHSCNDIGTVSYYKVKFNWNDRVFWSRLCSSCNGTKRKAIPYGHIYRRCSPCQGLGEIQIFNPVIPKGRLG